MEMSFTLETINDTARIFLVKYKGKKVFAFHGEMGAGKTTFIHALCDVLKVHGRVSNPTFSIINQYESGQLAVYRIDAYGIMDNEEAVLARVEYCLYSGHFCFVEWSSKEPSIFPSETDNLYFRVFDLQTRAISDSDK